MDMASATKNIAIFVPAVAVKAESRIGKTLGLKSMDAPSLIRAVTAGLSWSAVKKFLGATGLTQQELAHYLDIPERTFARRREAGAFDRREYGMQRSNFSMGMQPGPILGSLPSGGSASAGRGRSIT